MKRIVILVAALISIQSLSFSQMKNFIDQPLIETRAQVDTLVTPDRIYLNIIITEKDTKGKLSVEELESKMEFKLKSLGLNTERNLTLNDLASNFKKYFLKQKDVLKVKSYTLMVENAISAGNVIIALEKIEISNVTIDRTEYSEIEKLKLELKSKVILKAKKQAEYLCNPLNQKVGNAMFISDLNNYIRIDNRNSKLMLRGTSSFLSEKIITPVNIEFEKIKVVADVVVKFRIE